MSNTIEQREIAVPGAGLHGRQDQVAPNTLQLLSNMKHTVLEVDVLPPQSEDLAAAQAVLHQEQEGQVQRFALGYFQEPGEQRVLTSSPGSRRLAKYGPALAHQTEPWQALWSAGRGLLADCGRRRGVDDVYQC